MKRSKHGLSYYKLLTGNMGALIPVACFEVLPGDTVQQASSALIRVSPLVAPVMHPVTVRFHHWFVPHRLVWDGWEDFITGGPDGVGGGAGAYPVINAGAGFAAGGLMDYLGVPPAVANLEVSALPVRSYNMVYNEFYRDEDLVPEVPEDSITVQKCAWEKDYFTSSRPWPQKGPDVSLPLGVSAPVKGLGFAENTYPVNANSVRETGATAGRVFANAKVIGTAVGADKTVYVEQDTAAGRTGWPNIRADLANATAANVNDLRRAFALQRYQEARAMYGSRYTEYLRYLGVRSSDARLQRPEYLGGGKQTISFTEILQTGPDGAGEGVGELKGHGIAAMRSRRYRRFFEEHGIVLSIMSVRPRTMYGNGMDRMWSRRVKEDYWQKELERIGQQQVLRREVFAEASPGGATVFGWQDRYAEYRHIQSRVAGEFRTTLNYWHLGRMFGAAPALNQSFVECDPSKRIHAEQTQDVLWCMVNNSIQARRMVGRPGIGRIM